MTEKEQIDKLADAIDALINEYRVEFDLTYASVVGVLQMKAHLLMREAEEKQDEL